MSHKPSRRLLVWTMTAALTITGVPYSGTTASAKNASGVSKKQYTISKKAGTYKNKVTLKVTAKKGYQLYYTTGKTLRVKKKIASGRSKKLTIKKTTTLSVYAVRKGTTLTAKQLKSKKITKKTAHYRYKIIKSSGPATASSSANPTATSTAAASGSANPTATSTAAASGSANPMATSTAAASGSAAPGTSNAPAVSDTAAPGTSNAPAASSSAAPSKTSSPSGGSDVEVPSFPTPERPEETSLPDDYDPDSASTVTITNDGITTGNLSSDSAVTYEADADSDTATITIAEAGTYVLSGGSKESPLTNTSIVIKKNTGEVNLIWDNLYIDNSSLGSSAGQDSPVFQIKSGDKTTNNVTVYLKGDSVLKGNGSVYKETTDGTTTTSLPGGVIEAKGTDTVLTFASYSSDNEGSLTVTDSMDADTTDYGDEDPSDGISCKGTLIIQSGKYQIHSNGDCLKGTGADGNGGVFVLDGSLSLASALGNGIKSKNGNISIYDGSINITSTAQDGINAKNYTAAVSGGTLVIDHCQGDGIQAEWVSISGDDTSIDITTEYENAGVNYYNSSLGSGNYNTISSSNSSKTETVNVDTGSHKGIKAGTKSCSYSYKTVSDSSTDSDGNALVAGQIYTQEASGGLVITGGTITINTTQTGIKYNGGGGTGGMGGGSSSGAATSDGQYIIGAPDDTIHSNNICSITGGSLTLSSADDAITCADSLTVAGDTSIDIKTCYEGMEAGTINIGTSGSESGPSIVIYSNDDGINAASKSGTTYVYNDESEETYTKTSVSSSDNVLNIYSGYVNVMIADDETHTITLPVKNGSDNTITYSADGDGIDCNGSLYAYGGTIVVFGTTSNDNSPIDTDSTYYIGSGVTLLAVGSNGMIENPTSVDQAYLCTSSGNNGMRFAGPGGNSGPGGNGGPGGNSGSTYSAGTTFAITDSSGNSVLSICPNKTYGYVLYSSPELTSGASYTMYSGGSTSGSRLTDSAYDFRYEGFDSSGATTVSTTTASTTVQGGNTRP